MNVYTIPHPYYCGIDLHARRMYICILDDTGQIVYHKNRPCSPEALLAGIDQDSVKKYHEIGACS